jgi:hypothetical protein
MNSSLSGRGISQRAISKYKSLVTLLFSVVIALILLYAYNGRRIQADDFALGKENTSRSESLNGIPFTGHSIAEIYAIVGQYSLLQSNQKSKQGKIILWLGNSQLHTINQFKSGEHLAPYWLRKLAPYEDCLVPLGFSLSNANPQELFVLSQYVAKRVSLSALVLQVEFMGFREDGVRGEFSRIVTPDLVNSLRAYPIGKDLALLESGAEGNGEDAKKAGLDNVAKQDVEGLLTEKLGEIWPLWKDRVNLRSNVLGDLFIFRNWALNISSASQRKVIKPRYQKNMRALEDMLASLREANIPVVIYSAPVRQDKLLPYDGVEYAKWKEQVELLAKSYSATYVNLEKLIPPLNWGSNFGSDIDFMHFQEPGHKILAKELYPLIQAKVK